MKNFWNDFGKPILVLTLISLVISAALALTDNKTAPIIAAAEKAKAEAARMEVLPEADAFSPLSLDGLPTSVTEVFRAENGAGLVFMLSTKGYGGEIKLICGIDGEGRLVATSTLSQSETQGLGTKITLPGFTDQFVGKDTGLQGVDTISGATISSKAYINAIQDAFIAYELAKEAE